MRSAPTVSRITLLLSWIALMRPSFDANALSREELFGAWRLVSVEATADGKVSYPLGGEPKGLLLLTPDGYWSAQLMADTHALSGGDPARTYRAILGPTRSTRARESWCCTARGTSMRQAWVPIPFDSTRSTEGAWS